MLTEMSGKLRHSIDRLLLRPRQPEVHGEMTVLAVMPSEPEREYLRSLATQAGWELILTTDCNGALSVLDKREVPVILCDRDLPDQNWRDSVKTLLASVIPPCVILASPVNDSYLWQEVIHYGGYDVLAKPFQKDQVISTVRRAWIYWKAGRARSGGS